MYESLKKTTGNFHLYIFAFDDLTYEVIRSMNLDSVTVISLEEFESRELLEAKKTRTKGEYCWTCTPSTISYSINKFNLPACTYIDSDLFFFSDPSVLINELTENGKSVLITEHRFSALPKLYEEKRAGRFCVQFITFLNEEKSLQVLDVWRKQCIDWCFARYEDGKFGDQKYLDNWPETYSNIHILEHAGGGIAPWNLTRYRFFSAADSLAGIEKSNGVQFYVVFYHFQYVRFMENGLVDAGWYLISSTAIKLFYKPYLKKIIEIEKRIRSVNSNFHQGKSEYNTVGLRNKMKTGFKKIFGYNILNLRTNGISD
jgi:hypothetical protein